MAVDTTHAHLNMPATFMWAIGLEHRPMRVTFVPPAGIDLEGRDAALSRRTIR